MKSEEEVFIEGIVKNLVGFPNDVKVEKTVDEVGTLLTLTVNPTDMGKIIGKEGSNIKAIRTILRVFGSKIQARINLKVTDPRANSANADTAYDEAKGI